MQVLTGSLLFLLKFLLLFNIICLCVKVIIGVFGKLPLVVLVAQIRCPASEVHVELLDVNLHDAAVHGHANLTEKNHVQVNKHHAGYNCQLKVALGFYTACKILP